MTDYSDRLRKADWEVRTIEHSVAIAMVERLHYAGGGSLTRVYCHGLFEKARPAQCRGITLWIPPTKGAALKTYPTDWQGVLALSRLVIDDDVPKNAASFMLAGSRKLIDRDRWPCLVTYADEGQGHTGSIYLADNWIYVGRTDAERTFVREDGRMLSRKAGHRTRTHAEMKEIGATMIGKFAKHKFLHLAPGAGASVRRQGEFAL